jgi:hypothetical protein
MMTILIAMIVINLIFLNVGNADQIN